MASRLPRGAAKASASNPTNAPPREASIGDNLRAKEEAERVQLISYVNRLTAQNQDVEAAKVVFDAAKKARTNTFNLAKAAGFPRGELEDRMKEMQRPVFENVEKEVRVSRHRRWLGCITDEQRAMFTGDETPQSVKDEYHWRSEGYKAGLMGLARAAPDKCPAEHVQAFLKAHESGTTDSLAAIAANAPKPMRAQAADDFKADNPDVDVAAAARKLKNDPKFMDRTAPPETGAENPVAADDGFEATEQELAAQTVRPSVQESEEVV